MVLLPYDELRRRVQSNNRMGASRASLYRDPDAGSRILNDITRQLNIDTRAEALGRQADIRDFIGNRTSKTARRFIKPDYEAVGRNQTAAYLSRLASRDPDNPFGTDTFQQEPENPLGDLYASLIQQLQEPVTIDEANLMAQIRAQFDPVYDARADALRQMMASAKQRGARGRSEVRAAYEGLAEDYRELAPEAKEQAEEYRQRTEELYGELRSNIEGSYSRIMEDQEAEFEQLGIEAALPETQAPLQEDLASSVARAETLGTLAQQREMDVGQIDSAYWREGAPLATLTGANRTADMLADLKNYLRQRETDLSILEAERTSGIQSAFTQMLTQARQNAQAYEQWQTEQLLNMLASQQETTETEAPDMTDPDVFIQTLPPDLGRNVLDAYRQIERRPEAIAGRQFIGQQLEDYPVPGDVVPLTDAWWLNMVDVMLQNGDISPATAQALMQYIRLVQEA